MLLLHHMRGWGVPCMPTACALRAGGAGEEGGSSKPLTTFMLFGDQKQVEIAERMIWEVSAAPRRAALRCERPHATTMHLLARSHLARALKRARCAARFKCSALADRPQDLAVTWPGRSAASVPVTAAFCMASIKQPRCHAMSCHAMPWMVTTCACLAPSVR